MTKELHKPTFIISLDAESIWGYAAYPSHKGLDLLKRDDMKLRGCIDTLLSSFEKYKIPVTWTVVEHLFLDHCEKEDGMPHKEMSRFFIARVNTDKISKSYLEDSNHWFVQLGDSDFV